MFIGTEEEAKLNKILLKELPFYSCNIDQFLKQFNINNILYMNLPTKNYLERLSSFHDLYIFTGLNACPNESEEFKYYFPPIRSKCYSPYNFAQSINSGFKEILEKDQFFFIA